MTTEKKKWENKLKKVRISSDPKDWRNIKNIPGMEKRKKISRTNIR